MSRDPKNMSNSSEDRDEPRVKRRRRESQSPPTGYSQQALKDESSSRSRTLEKEGRSSQTLRRPEHRSRSPFRKSEDGDGRDDRRDHGRSGNKHGGRDKDKNKDRNKEEEEEDGDKPSRGHRRRRENRSRSQTRSRSRSRSQDRHRNKHSHRDRSAERHHKRRDRDDRRPRYNSNRNHSRSRSTSPPRRPIPHERSRGPLSSQNDAFQIDRVNGDPEGAPPAPPKQKPNFSTTGVLAAASNTIHTANQTIVLKYHEPPESRKPPATQPWRMYVFKSDEILDTLPLAEQTCWLFGRETAVCDVPLEHASCSKQHAVIQFRYVETRTEFGERKGKVRPYVLDLESTHGTTVNGKRIPDAKYVSLLDGDVVQFGQSSREYVIQLPPTSKD